MIAKLDGYKTWIAAIGLVGLAVYHLSQKEFESSLKVLMEALGLIGVAHKIMKVNTNETKNPVNLSVDGGDDISS